MWIPRCGSASEIGRAEELGAEVVKIFPGPSVGGPGFIKAYLGPCPWSLLMPSGGVTPDENNLKEWFDAGAFCVGMGSRLISKEIIEKKDFAGLEKSCRETLEIVKRISK